jgi:hypothetical protein
MATARQGSGTLHPSLLALKLGSAGTTRRSTYDGAAGQPRARGAHARAKTASASGGENTGPG